MPDFERCRNPECDHAASRHAHPVGGREKIALHVLQKRISEAESASRRVTAAMLELVAAREEAAAAKSKR